MKNKIKLSSLMIAACMSVGIAVPFNLGGTTADAATWKCGDVNNDGNISMMDVVSVNKYVAGEAELVDYSKADTNADCVIDCIDGSILNRFLAEQIPSLPYAVNGDSSRATINAQPVNSSMNYTIFNAKSGAYIDSYSLSANAVIDKSKSAIVVDEPREIDNDMAGVVKIITNKGLGTGFIVDGHTIATAAHVIFDRANGGYSDSSVKIEKIIILDENGEVEKTVTDEVQLHVPNSYIASNDYSSYDYGMITVEQDLSDYAGFELGMMNEGMLGSDIEVYSTGFPGVVNNNNYVNTATKHNKYSDTGFVKNAGSNKTFFYEPIVTGGNSGGPVYVKTEYNGKEYAVVIGITTVATWGGDNIYNGGGGVRMTTNLLHFYKNNPNIAY